MIKLLNFLFKVQIIDDSYLIRWKILQTPWGRVYLHKFIGSDPSHALHDHPKNFISIGLFGEYVEEVPHGIMRKKVRFKAPWLRSFPPEHRHRIELPRGACWTLCIVSKRKRNGWGFWHGGLYTDSNSFHR